MNGSMRMRAFSSGRNATVRALVVLATLALSGCAAGSGTNSSGRTQYKGDSVWNISSTGGTAARVPRRA